MKKQILDKNTKSNLKSSSNSAKMSASKPNSSKNLMKNSAKKLNSNKDLFKISNPNLIVNFSKNSINLVSKLNSKKQAFSPKFRARQAKIKAVALDLFLSKGYEETSIKDIISVAGGSYSDIYGIYKNKQGLFIGVINDILERKQTAHHDLLARKLPLREFLTEFSRGMLGAFVDERTLGLVRIIYSQLYKRQNHALVEHFKESKENVPEQTLVKYFEGCEPPLCDNAPRYAELFFILLKGKWVERIFFFDEPIMSRQEQEEYVDFVVDFFMRGIL